MDICQYFFYIMFVLFIPKEWFLSIQNEINLELLKARWLQETNHSCLNQGLLPTSLAKSLMG